MHLFPTGIDSERKCTSIGYGQFCAMDAAYGFDPSFYPTFIHRANETKQHFEGDPASPCVHECDEEEDEKNAGLLSQYDRLEPRLHAEIQEEFLCILWNYRDGKLCLGYQDHFCFMFEISRSLLLHV